MDGRVLFGGQDFGDSFHIKKFVGSSLDRTYVRGDGWEGKFTDGSLAWSKQGEWLSLTPTPTLP